jgi:hypothetical protein
MFPLEAWAQRVLLTRPTSTDRLLFEAFGRLRAELELQSFEVIILEDQAKLKSADDLEEAAQDRGAFAAIALRRGGRGSTARILIVDRVTGKSTTRNLLIEKSPNGPTLLAVRAADLLRSSLLEFEPGERPPREVVGVVKTPPSPEVVRFASEHRRFEVHAGGIALFNPELGYGVGPLFGARVRLGRLRLGLDAQGPLHGAEFRSNNGIASVRQELAMLTLGWNLGSEDGDGHWELSPTLGAGIYHLRATSVVAPPLVAQADAAWSFSAAAGFALQYFFNPTLDVGLAVGGVALLPRPVVAVDDAHSSPIALQGQVTLHLGVAF